MLKLFQIEYMLEACKYGSISKAADKLMVSRPAISRALRDLEDEFGLELFTRTTGGISLTETGVFFYDKCKAIRGMISNLETEMHEIKKQMNSQQEMLVRLGLSPLACSDFFPAFYKDFADMHPDIVFEIHEALGTQTPVMIAENTIDASITIGIRESYDNYIEKPATLNILDYELFFVCGTSHHLANHSTIQVSDIENESYIQLDKTLVAHNLFRSKMPTWFEPNIKFRTTQVSMVYEMVKTGQLCSLQFKKRNDNRKHEEGIVFIPFKEPAYFPLRVIWNEAIPHTHAFRDFIAYLENKKNSIF